jgi:hypothetical protein
MPLLDLSGVTRTLARLLEFNILRLEGLTVTVTPESPEQVDDATSTLSLHLYHIAEEAGYENLPGPGSDVPNIAANPLALRLYYILTAHHDSGNEESDAFTRQHILGLALKTMHDFPVITDATEIGPQQVFHPIMRNGNNRLDVILRPVTPEDALAFWSAEDTRTTRVSGYYEVRVVLLQPERPRTQPGIVLSIGQFLIQLGTPQIDCSRNVVRFRLPLTAGGGEQAIETSPARASLDAGGPPGQPNNRVELLGTNLAAGLERTLLLRNALWTTDGFDPVELDPDLNPAWNVVFHTDRVVLDVQPQLLVEDGAGGTVVLDVRPGSYSVALRVVQDQAIVQGQLKRITATSNETVLFVTPRILGPVPVVPAGDTIALDVGAEFDLLDPAFPAGALSLVVEGFVYEQAGGPPAEGEFQATSVPSVSNTVTFDPVFPTAVTAPEARACRLIVNGAESPPFWVELQP